MDSLIDRHKLKHRKKKKEFGERGVGGEGGGKGDDKKMPRQAEKDRESCRHTAGRWRSLPAPRQRCDEESGEGN